MAETSTLVYSLPAEMVLTNLYQCTIDGLLMMYRTLFCSLIASMSFFACTSDTQNTADREFEELTSRYIETWLSTHPEQATRLGDARYNDRMNDYSRVGIEADIALYQTWLDTLLLLKVEELSAQHMIDYDIMHRHLLSNLFMLRELREWEWNPLIYNPGGALYSLIARDNAPFVERMRAMTSRLRQLPRVLDAARENLDNPPAIHTETAITQNEGVISLLTQTLQPFIDSLDSPLRADITSARDDAVDALKSYGAWLTEKLLPESRRDYRLGVELYAEKFAHRLDTDMSPDLLLQRAWEDLEACNKEMYHIALPMYEAMHAGKSAEGVPPERVIREVLRRISDERPDDATIVERSRQYLEEATDFVAANDFVTIPTEPLEIIVMPEFQRGVAVAYCDAPGPLDRNGKTFFAIAPTPAQWSKQRRESFYREYNNAMLKNLVIHEAMPGHYLQLAIANRAEAPTLLRAIMPSGVFAEGWATYTEQLMADAGFGGPELKMQQLKMRLRLLINAILDQSVHTLGMTEREAMALMMERGYQEEGEASGKWRRACLTSAQLSTYYYGNIMINDIRARYEAQQAADFSLRSFHDTLLSYGTISPKYFPVLLRLAAPIAAN
jgi:uncharacterized protein (DUF885 family)